jgi:DNA polymerase-3 subunit epsilon
LGGRQPGLDFAITGGGAGIGIALPQDRPPRPPRPHAPSLEELVAHQAMLATLKTPLWLAGA